MKKERCLETKKRILNCYVISNYLNGIKYVKFSWISKGDINGEKYISTDECLYYYKQEKLKNEDDLSRISTTKIWMATIRKCQQIFSGHIMKKEILRNLIFSCRFEEEEGKGKQRITYLVSHRKWIVEQWIQW